MLTRLIMDEISVWGVDLWARALAGLVSGDENERAVESGGVEGSLHATSAYYRVERQLQSSIVIASYWQVYHKIEFLRPLEVKVNN